VERASTQCYAVLRHVQYDFMRRMDAGGELLRLWHLRNQPCVDREMRHLLTETHARCPLLWQTVG
jgi:hypothetical protein